MATVKNLIKTVTGRATQDGAGVKLIRVIGHDDVREADPVLMLDAFDSANPDDYLRGFPMHPHRGIETVTYLIEGRIDHRDSLGNAGSIRTGQAQWMTAGSGIMHEEMPQKSERLFGLQFWLNLPQAEKMTPPQYFDITDDMIPTVELDAGTVRVIAGTFDGVEGARPRHVQVTMLDVTLRPNQTFSMPVDGDATALVYTLEGDGFFGPATAHHISKRTAAIFGQGDTFLAKAGGDGLRFVLVAGRPLREPVAWGGPIVMNTQQELQAAFRELNEGTFIRS